MRELSPDARRLLDEVGGRDGPSAVRRARVKARLAARLAASGVALSATQLAAAASVPAGAVAVGKATVGASTIALWLVGGALAGSAVMAPIALSSRPERPAVSDGPHLRAATRADSSQVVGRAPRVVAPPAQANEGVAVTAAPSAVRVERSLGTGVPHPARALSEATAIGGGAPPPSNVGAEAALLESAQRELASGQGERALESLRSHEAQFPNGALNEERAFARVIALCQLGRTGEARASAEAFLRAAPRSPLLPRLRKSCAFAPENPGKGEP